MEQLTEFVAKSFVESKPPPVIGEDRKEATCSTATINAAHMISNILSTMPQMSSVSNHWPLTYPFPLFTGQPELSAFHSKFAINSMVERFSEIQHQLNQSQQLHYPTTMLYSHKSAIFPFLLSNETSTLLRNETKDKDNINSSLRTHECNENSDPGKLLQCCATE